MAKHKTVPVSVRALIQRINRNLAKDQKQLKSTRGDRWRNELGDYYIIDENLNAVIEKHVTLEVLGRDLCCLSAWEAVSE